MSIEIECEKCKSEYDARHGECPVCIIRNKPIETKTMTQKQAQTLLKKYKENEAHNYHSNNLLLLANAFGTEHEQRVCNRNITAISCGKTSSLLVSEQVTVNTYYYKLVALAKVKPVIGYPFVKHVDQDARPTMEVDYLHTVYSEDYTCELDNMLREGVVKRMGYMFNFKPYLKHYLYKQYGQWNEVYAPNKTALRKCIHGKINRIVELKK